MKVEFIRFSFLLCVCVYVYSVFFSYDLDFVIFLYMNNSFFVMTCICLLLDVIFV